MLAIAKKSRVSSGSLSWNFLSGAPSKNTVGRLDNARENMREAFKEVDRLVRTLYRGLSIKESVAD